MKHSFYIRMIYYGCPSFSELRLALQPLLCKCYRLLISTFTQGNTLVTNRQSCIIHHTKHAHQTLIFRSNQITSGTTIITIYHCARWTSMNAKFLLYSPYFDIVLIPYRAIWINKVFGHKKH